MNSKIAVIMPVYNAGKFLKGSIESVLAQKFKDISLICIDDVSIDDSSKIIEEYLRMILELFILKMMKILDHLQPEIEDLIMYMKTCLMLNI